MSEWSDTIVDIDVTAQNAPQLAEAIRAWLVGEGVVEPEISDSALGNGGGYRPGANYRIAMENADDPRGLRTNGLEILVGRQMFISNVLELRCDACGCTFEPFEHSDSSVCAFTEAMNAWLEGDDQASFACPECGQRRLLAEWRGPSPWGFGYLGLTFWNWWLSENFVQTVTGKLGHRTILVRARL